jgi:ribonuclease P protein subunit POP4
MTITAQNLHRHELIGLECEVFKCSDEGKEGIQGEVLDETQSMLRIKNQRVEKQNCVFKFTLPDGTEVELDGERINSRPEERIENS